MNLERLQRRLEELGIRHGYVQNVDNTYTVQLIGKVTVQVTRHTLDQAYHSARFEYFKKVMTRNEPE